MFCLYAMKIFKVSIWHYVMQRTGNMLNKIFSIVWNKNRSEFMVTSENAGKIRRGSHGSARWGVALGAAISLLSIASQAFADGSGGANASALGGNGING